MCHLKNLTAPFVVLAAFVALTGENCSEAGEGCRETPAGYARVFFRSPAVEYPRTVISAVQEVRPGSEPGSFFVALRDSAGAADTLVLSAAGHEIPLETGRTYTFEVDHAGGFPTLSGLIVSDPGGLLFAAVTDRSPSRRIFAGGIPGFELTLVSTDCDNRNDDPCYDAVTNEALHFVHGGESIEIMNREAARLGDFQITCLAAQRIDYNSSCADAGLPSLSFVLVRSDAAAKP